LLEHSRPSEKFVLIGEIRVAQMHTSGLVIDPTMLKSSNPVAALAFISVD